MKNRNLFNNIFTVIIMLSLVFFLLAYFQVFGNESVEGWIQKITLPLALASAICMEIVLPVLDNKEMFKREKKMRILLIVKIILVVAAIVPLVLNVTGALAQNTKAEFGVLAAFVILYMAQFFINLDPKPEVSDEDEDDEDDEDEEEEDDGEYEEDGDEEDSAEEAAGDRSESEE
jgi:quinol-cytochrome oxidoreductase complex cytochrome b subunit